MAPLSLKIILDGGAVTRTVQFDSRATVESALALVRDKLPTATDGKDLAFFLTSADNENSGVWLEPCRTLEYYMLRDGDSLLYLSRLRNLRVRMLDGTVKTLQVDETRNIGDLMMVICNKIGITNYDEYGLCHEEVEEAEEAKDKPATGTLTLRKVHQRERDAKMDELSKKLKTDDNVHWLDQHKTLREMGVEPNETLLLKRRLFYSDRNVDSRDPVQLNLLYLQTRNAILEGRHLVTENQAADCKVRWINIRDVHRRFLKKVFTNPGQTIKTYKYDSELEFMKPFYKDVISSDKDFEFEDNINDDIESDNQIDAQHDDDDSEEEEKPIKKLKSMCQSSKKKKRKRLFQRIEENPEIPEVVFPETVASSDFDSSDPVDAFLLSIGATLKTFTPYHLNLAKSKIFSIVQEHDLQQIVQRQRHDDSHGSYERKVSTASNAYNMQ